MPPGFIRKLLPMDQEMERLLCNSSSSIPGRLTTLIGDPITLPGVGTNPHTLRLTFQTNSIAAYFDGVLKTNVTDNGSIDGQPAYTNGTVSLDMYTYTTAYTMTVDNVIVSALATVANNDSYNAAKNTALHVAAPGVLANDSGGSGSLTALLVSNPSNGSLTLTNNGGFTYTPANNFTGVDSFTYEATDGQTTSSVATVTITVNNFPVANNDSYAVAENTSFDRGTSGNSGQRHRWKWTPVGHFSQWPIQWNPGARPTTAVSVTRQRTIIPARIVSPTRLPMESPRPVWRR